MKGYIYIALTILFTVYGQVVVKWKMAKVGQLPNAIGEKLIILLSQFTNIWLLTAFVSAFLAALSWMAALTRFELSYAYPFMSLSFVLVLVLSNLLFQEPINLYKIFGIALIMIGIIVGAR